MTSAPSPADRASVRDKTLKPVTIITGGSIGIGEALAFEFAKGGFELLLLARDQAALDDTADRLRARTDVPIHIHAIDLTRHDICVQVDAVLHGHGLYCQQLVNNAGMGLADAFANHSEEALLDLLDLNIRALSALSRHYLPDMLARNEGGILNVASLGGFIAGPYQAAYYASKAYVLSLSQALSWELWGTNIRISALAPGPVRTDFHNRMGARRALYYRLGAGISPQRAAKMGYSGFMCGKALIVPGYLSQLNVLAMKFIPHDLMLPFLGWFLKARKQGHKHAADK